MSKIMTWCTGMALVGTLAGCGQPAAGQTAGSHCWAIGSWGNVIEVPGLGALSTGKHAYARVNSVSCASAGNCAAGGYYTLPGGDQEAFVAVERDGRWGTAAGGTRPCGPEQGRVRRGQRDIVPLAGQLRRRRCLHRPFRAPPGIRHPGQIACRGRLSGSGGQIQEALTMKRLWPAILAVAGRSVRAPHLSHGNQRHMSAWNGRTE